MRKMDFLKNALSDLKIGALFPSSRSAARTILKQLPKNAQYILEFGPGDGILTKKILRELSPSGKIIGIELNNKFVQELNTIRDSRLSIVEGEVLEVLFQKALKNESFDAIISGIPFSLMPKERRRKILVKTHELLKPGGVFIAYQTTPLLHTLLKKYFKKVSLLFEPRNLPPYFIMTAKK